MQLKQLPPLLLPLLAYACSSADEAPPAEALPPPRMAEFSDAPLPGLSAELEATFNDGDLRFSTPLRGADGLGPLYTRSACAACHADGIRGPGLVQKMSVVDLDGVTPALDQSELAFGHTVHPLVASEGLLPILPPSNLPNIKVTTRLGPTVLGRGFMEAIADSEIERVAALQAARTDGIQGRINHVFYASEPNIDTSFHTLAKGERVIGRFGLKARVATLDDFAADAFQGDMGITSPLRPVEFANPSGITDDAKPGIDVDYDSVNQRAMYIRMLEIPERRTTDAGAQLFEETLCSACHVPALATRADYPIPQLAGVQAPVYSDLLLHQMGKELADGLPANPAVDGEAGSFEWRTAPLIALRFNRTYMHDGRAKTIEEAILSHRGEGSEANIAVEAYEDLAPSDQQLLLEFVQAL